MPVSKGSYFRHLTKFRRLPLKTIGYSLVFCNLAPPKLLRLGNAKKNKFSFCISLDFS